MSSVYLLGFIMFEPGVIHATGIWLPLWLGSNLCAWAWCCIMSWSDKNWDSVLMEVISEEGSRTEHSSCFCCCCCCFVSFICLFCSCFCSALVFLGGAGVVVCGAVVFRVLQVLISWILQKKQPIFFSLPSVVVNYHLHSNCSMVTSEWWS